jgi:hypothetical protein
MRNAQVAGAEVTTGQRTVAMQDCNQALISHKDFTNVPTQRTVWEAINGQSVDAGHRM